MVTMEWLERPTEEDIHKLAKVAARAFENDMGNYLYYGGIRHSQAPETSEAIFRAWLRRGLAGRGIIATDPERRCMRLMFQPGAKNRTHDRSLDSSGDPDWATLEQNVDMGALWARIAAVNDGFAALLRERYGDHPELLIWRSAMTVVDPLAQGNGLGKAMNKFILDRVKRSGMPWGHGCLGHTVEFYKRSGMHVVARLSPNAIVDPSWKGGKHADGRPDVYWMETDDNPPSVNGV